MFDIIIIGSGPGGYVAAERAGQAGKKVLLIEKESLGGVCLNSGCIPTKSLLHCAKAFKTASESSRCGVITENVQFDLEAAMKWKNTAVSTLQKGIAFLMKKYGVEVVTGFARLAGVGKVDVNGQILEAKAIIIATGSSADLPPVQGINSALVVTNKEILDIKVLPGRVAIIGAGVIGIEYASFFAALGVETQVFEMQSEILPVMDKEQAAVLRKAMKKTVFHLDTRVIEVSETGIKYIENDVQGFYACDLVLAATGRTPNIKELGLEAAGVVFTPKGIPVDECMRTNIEGVYAIGDVTGQCMLAHGASRMGEVAVNSICGIQDTLDYSCIPWAIYSIPEAAGCGLDETTALQRGYEIEVQSSGYRSNGRFLAEYGFGSESAGGTAKIIVDKKSGVILGVHLLGPYASENIAAAAILVQNKLTVKDMSKVVFPHPTFSEVMHEAVADSD